METITTPINYAVSRTAIAKGRIAATVPEKELNQIKTTYFQDMWALCGPNITLEEIEPYWALSKDLGLLGELLYADPDELFMSDYKAICRIIKRHIPGTDAEILDAVTHFNREAVDVDYDVEGLAKVMSWIKQDPTMQQVTNLGYVLNRYLVNLLMLILDQIKRTVENYRVTLARHGFFTAVDKDGEFLDTQYGKVYF